MSAFIVLLSLLPLSCVCASTGTSAVNETGSTQNTAIKTADAQLICNLSAALKHTTNVSAAFMERAFDMESAALEKMKLTEKSLRFAIGEVIKASARIRRSDAKLNTFDDEIKKIESSVNSAHVELKALFEKVKHIVLRAIALSARAGVISGMIDDFIAVFESANSHKNYRCITKSGDSLVNDSNPAAKLEKDLNGCTWDHYADDGVKNLSRELIEQVAQLGGGVLVQGIENKDFTKGGANCPFLISDFVREKGTPLLWGGLWKALQKDKKTQIEWKDRAENLTDIVKELKDLEGEFTHRKDAAPSDENRSKTLQQLVSAFDAALTVTVKDGKVVGDAQRLAMEIMQEAQAVERENQK
ncbi:putative Trypanosome variant surface glycoprotein (A type) [Trypanosoma vivax]|uniref:Uncharacterized protein n=1 Tax=Trypanosoma vivax (strain Y486) TaxID=1055687 RepID=F9WR47_TRYVY|nr:putative Trypanosome variant surface glycoprotein (A type) [Trypanosoma vivax]CCD20031.1 hypothetical protein, conserved in T. vivax [Trypanosoma vivax Y486]|eukprot:CCD20031.1 hypothetical protein, conserved in T. vivax [Trypanosoma vivax Y486]